MYPMIGYIVVSRNGPLDGRLHCGTGIYTHAICVSIDPFVCISEDGDMRWNNLDKHDFIILCVAPKKAQEKALDRFTKDQSSKQKPEFLPCPFCGSSLDNEPPGPYPRGKWIMMVCGNPACGASIAAETVEEATQRWNRRVQ